MPTYLVKPNVGDACVGSAYHPKMELNERLKRARNAVGLTQKAVAEHFGIQRVSVTQWELGETRPDPEKFGALADLYGVSLDWLLEERGDGPVDGAKRPARPAPPPAKFIKSRAFKFYVAEWREFMGVKVVPAAKAAGLDPDEYEAHEVYPINFTLGQVSALAVEFGIRGDQFWFPPPKGKPAPISSAHAAKKRARR